MKVGDRVVCVGSHSNPRCPLRVGIIYMIMGCKECPTCGGVGYNVGIGTIPEHQWTRCTCGARGAIDSVWWISSKLFRPIQYNSATEELANKKVVEEKSDIPIKEPQKEKV